MNKRPVTPYEFAQWELKRAFLARDFWMSVGFVEKDFNDEVTWSRAFKRGPIFKSKAFDMMKRPHTKTVATQTEPGDMDEDDGDDTTIGSPTSSMIVQPLDIETIESTFMGDTPLVSPIFMETIEDLLCHEFVDDDAEIELSPASGVNLSRLTQEGTVRIDPEQNGDLLISRQSSRPIRTRQPPIRYGSI